MSESGDAGDFDSLAYWRTRHDQYLHDAKGVGNAALDTAENERIYAAIDRYVASIAEALKTAESPKALDLGCGIGMLAAAFLRKGYEYLGVDISETAVQIARAGYPAARFEVGNIADLGSRNPFDLIIERTVFIHLVEDDYWMSVLGEVKRLLAPKGVFVIIDHLPISDGDAPRGATHVKFRRHDQYAKRFAELGLTFNTQIRDAVATHVALSPHTHFVTHVG